MDDVLGLPPPVLAVYRALLRQPDTAPGALAARLGPDVDVPAALQVLQDRGLLRPRADGGGLVPQRPDVVAEPLLAQEQRALAARQEQLARARREVTDLVDLYVAGAASTRDVEVERVEGPALGRRLGEVVDTATRELLTIGVSADLSAEQAAEASEHDERSFRRGVRSRTVQPDAVRDVPHLMAYALESVPRGDAWRVMPSPPMTLLVVDRTAGIVPVDQDHLDRGAYVVWSPAIVRGFVALFELAWQVAVPLFSERVGTPDDPLTPRDRQLLELLAAGGKDEAVARQLGLGLRTVRRDAARLTELLGARTRFQAGVEAARRGWL